jgi:hypothetical protein
MTDASWEDYVDLSGVSATDPGQAVTDVSDAVTDFAQTTAATGGVSDLDQVALDTAAYQTDLAEGQQSWADWNSDLAASATTDANAYVEDAAAAAAQGDLAGAQWSLDHAETYADNATDAAATAASYEQSTADQLGAAEASLDSVDYSGLGTAAFDATSYDTTSYDTSLDTSFDTGSEY